MWREVVPQALLSLSGCTAFKAQGFEAAGTLLHKYAVGGYALGSEVIKQVHSALPASAT